VKEVVQLVIAHREMCVEAVVAEMGVVVGRGMKVIVQIANVHTEVCVEMVDAEMEEDAKMDVAGMEVVAEEI